MKIETEINVTFYTLDGGFSTMILDRWTKDYSYCTLSRLYYIDYKKESINAV